MMWSVYSLQTPRPVLRGPSAFELRAHDFNSPALDRGRLHTVYLEVCVCMCVHTCVPMSGRGVSRDNKSNKSHPFPFFAVPYRNLRLRVCDLIMAITLSLNPENMTFCFLYGF